MNSNSEWLLAFAFLFAIIISPIIILVYIIKTKGLGVKHFMLPLLSYIFIIVLAICTNKYAYSNKEVIGYQTAINDGMFQKRTFEGYEPIYKYENLGIYLLIILPIISNSLLFTMIRKPPAKKSIMIKSLVLFPLYMAIAFYVIMLASDYYKPFFHEEEMENINGDMYPK